MAKISRPMWVWNTRSIINCATATDKLLSAAVCASVTDLYLYMDASHYQTYFELVKSFNARARTMHIEVWALEGGQVYFSDADGPRNLYKGIQNMIDFNARVEESEKFAGFSADLEPHARGFAASFHNGVKDSDLDTAIGTGDWQESQAADRSALMRDWLNIHRTAKAMLNANGLPLAAAFPHWVCDYCGEPLRVRWPDDRATLRRVMELMMTCVDDYVIMSYHVNPSIAAARLLKEVEYATEMRRESNGSGPRVLAAVETTKGVGHKISYGDEASPCSRSMVLKDINSITAALQHHEAFGGVAIHAWSGWDCLPEQQE